MSRGADVAATTKDGETAADVSRAFGTVRHREVLKLLTGKRPADDEA